MKLQQQIPKSIRKETGLETLYDQKREPEAKPSDFIVSSKRLGKTHADALVYTIRQLLNSKLDLHINYE